MAVTSSPSSALGHSTATGPPSQGRQSVSLRRSLAGGRALLRDENSASPTALGRGFPSPCTAGAGGTHPPRKGTRTPARRSRARCVKRCLSLCGWQPRPSPGPAGDVGVRLPVHARTCRRAASSRANTTAGTNGLSRGRLNKCSASNVLSPPCRQLSKDPRAPRAGEGTQEGLSECKVPSRLLESKSSPAPGDPSLPVTVGFVGATLVS